VTATGTVTAPENRPGTTYFAPAVRIAKLGDDLRPGETGTTLPEDVLHDVTRVEVVRVNTGMSQYTLTLNNMYLAAAADRAAAERQHTGTRRRDAAASRELLVKGQPAWPRFKYNDFHHLAFGHRLRIDMRYWPDRQGDADRARQADAAWVPMIAGPITDMRFAFSERGAELTISGQDDLSRLQDKAEKRVEMNRAPELTIVRRVLERADFPLQIIARPLVEYPAFVTDDAQGLHEALHAGQSHLDYLQKLAERLDFEVFLEFADLDRPQSGLEFHFEPYRGRKSPLGAGRETFVLHRERTLLGFAPTIRVVDQFSSVRVRGRHRDPRIPEEVTGDATDAIIADELHRDPGLDPEVHSGPAVRQRFFRKRENPHNIQNEPNLDRVRADWRAQVEIRRKARELFSIDGQTIGLPKLRPGQHVEIRGMRPPFDGFYYVTKTTHTLGGDGFRTRFTASRPGMPLPDDQGRFDERAA
jgi:hypothetical protein